MWFIVGLGNPGPEYARTRHNVGFMVVEAVARRWGIELADDDPTVRCGRGRFAGHDVFLAEPQTFMNRSGEVVARCPRTSEDPLVVVYDDLDLPPGQIRVRRNGGSGGHRGVASIVTHVGPDFARVRVGIGRPAEGADAGDHVLAILAEAELTAMHVDVERAGDAVECIVADGTDVAMNRFNGRVLPDTN